MQSNKYVSGNFFCRALPYCITFYIFSKTYYKKSRKPNAEFWSNLHKSGESEEVHQFLHPRCFCCISLISLLYFYYSEKDESKFLERFTVESTEQKEFVFVVLRNSPYSVRMWKNTVLKSPNTDTSFAVETITSSECVHQFFILDLYERKIILFPFYHQNNSFGRNRDYAWLQW